MDDKIALEITSKAALHASNSLSKLTGNPVEVKFSQMRTSSLDDIPVKIRPEEMVTATYLRVTGDVSGAALLVLPVEGALLLSDTLLKREAGTTTVLKELETSALKEVGNIVTGAYLTVLSDVSGVRLVENAPHFSSDMFGAVLSQVLAECAARAQEALVAEVEFAFVQPPIRAHLLVLFTLEDSNKIFGAAECR